MNAEAEKRKGFMLAIEGEPIHLPLVYGYQKVGGVRTYHNTTKSRSIQAVQEGFTRFRTGLSADSHTSKTRDFLWVQQALCFGGIDGIIDVEVDGHNWDMDTFNHVLDFSLNGGIPNATATANGIPDTNRFTNTAYLTGMFALNRDDPQYNGVPEVAAYVRGNKIETVTLWEGEYSLSGTQVFSNNPALVLLDYLIRPKSLGGCGYDVSEINLKSFYDAALICDTVVAEDVQVVGRINGVKPVEEGQTPAEVFRDIKLYECNLTIDTNETRRDNIERILETMAQSDLIWSEGQYKLVLDYPTSAEDQDDLVTATYTDEDIVNQEVNITWAGVQDRFNRATVKFLNEEQDFATDSVSWPPYGSEIHQDYLDEDIGIENEVQYFIQGATHRRSAFAKAEELVRNSRISKSLTLELIGRALVHEQGDLVKINSVSAEIVDEVYRIEEIQITDNLTVKVSLVRFDYQTLAYNVTDTTSQPPVLLDPGGVPNVENLIWTVGSRLGGLNNGWLSWDEPEDLSIRKHHIFFRPLVGQFAKIGETVTNYYDIPAELNNGNHYYFLVRSENNEGRLSPGVVVLLEGLAQIVPVSDLTATAGINSVTLEWENASPELALRYDIYQGITDVRGDAVKVGSTTYTWYTVSPLAVQDYYFWVDSVGLGGAIGALTDPVLVTESELGLKSEDFLNGIITWDALHEDLQDSITNVLDEAEELANTAITMAQEAAADALLAANTAYAHATAANTAATDASTFASDASFAANTAASAASLAGIHAGDAEGFAIAAANSAFFAAIEANTAGSFASAADSSAISASTSAGNANTSATAAANSASVAISKALEAGNYAAEALDYSSTAARVSSGGVSKNPVFSEWANTEPDFVTIYTWGDGTIDKATTGVRYVNALDLIGVNAYDSGPVVKLGKFAQSLDCSSNPSAVSVRAELELRSGTLDGGAYISANWATENGTDAEAKVYLNEQMRDETGIVQVVDIYLERPDSYDEGTGWIDFSIELSVSEWDNATGTCTLRVHKLDFEEVLANSSTEIYQRSVAQLDGITSGIVGLRAVANTAGAELELVALDDPLGNSASVARISATNIILDGTITADHLNASSFSVSGMALFGGTLQSSDFVTGVSGWQIKDDGDSEFNNLRVRRDMILDGAVSDTVLYTSPIVNFPRGTSYSDQTSIGAFPIGKFAFVGWGGEFRRFWKTPFTRLAWDVYVERRLKENGAWGEWVEIAGPYTTPNPSTNPNHQELNYSSFGGGELLFGVYEDVEYRFRSVTLFEGDATYSGRRRNWTFKAQTLLK